jgi:hypothetical protein
VKTRADRAGQGRHPTPMPMPTSAAWRNELALPARIGPVEFGELGRLIAVRCPHDFDHLMRKAGGQWEPGSRRWLIERRRIGPVIRALEAATDPLFRRAGISLAQ